MIKADIINNVIKSELRNIIRDSIFTLTNEYISLSKALFIFNEILMPNIVEWYTSEGIKAYLAEE
jgi:hypothetical protein